MTQAIDGTVGLPPSRRELALGVGRAFGGSLLFVLPILMTMEMWQLGQTLPPERVALWVAGTLPLLVLLARYLGFRDRAGTTWPDHIADALIAYGVGVVTAAIALTLFGLLDPARSPHEVVRLIAIESVPASIGAVIARGQFGAVVGTDDGGSSSYPGELLLMAVGAGAFSFNIAPTEEIVAIATIAGPLRGLALAAVTMAMMHAIVYLVGFRGQHRSEASARSVFLGYTVAGYGAALAVSLGLLWLFGRTAQLSPGVVALEAVVLGLPAGLGAAAARLIL